MKSSGNPPLLLTYCTNIHPGESWKEIFENLRQYTVPIRERVALNSSFGLGLRLSDLASLELLERPALEQLKGFLEEHNFYVFTMNGFPYGRFHGMTIKEKVFAPDWTRPERLDYTNRLADLLGELLPDGTEGSISTLPASFKEWITTREQVDVMAANLADCVAHLRQIADATGKIIHLGLEPEPLGYVETVDEFVGFLGEHARKSGAKRLQKVHGFSENDAQAAINRHLGICYDTCHMAIEFENPAAALEKLRRANVLLSKVQISSALRLKPSVEGLKELERYADGVYLHQVIARGRDGSLKRWKDIRPALEDREALAQSDELRVHCHVPLYMTEHRGLSSTADHIVDLLKAMKQQNKVAHFEIETYTWDVLPDELRREAIAEAVAKEFHWFLDRLVEVDIPSPFNPA